MPTLLVFGLGYSGGAIARLAQAHGFSVIATTRTPRSAPPGLSLIPFDAAGPSVATATHILATAPPGPDGDPILARHGDAIRAASNLRWLGYLSTTGVYGDRAGGWVDETTPPAPTSPRSIRRLAAEQQWRAFSDRLPVDLFRLAGIYGVGRSALNDLRAGTARRILAPNHAFGRIHLTDIAGATLAATARTTPGPRILNLSDDEPAPSADVIAEAARLLGIPPPSAKTLAEAWPAMSDMARSFWSENRKVRSSATQTALARPWTYPTYREGLRAILAEETE